MKGVLRKVLLILSIALIVFPNFLGTGHPQAWAAPFLTCDCTPAADKVTSFQLQFGTQPAIDVPAVECVPVVTDGKRILYDLGTLPNGAFTVRALAKNLWGQSDYTPFLSDNKRLPGSPTLLKITP